MFRSKKKKIRASNRRVVRTFDSDDDENNDADQVGTKVVREDEEQRLDVDEPPSALLIALQQRKKEKRNKKRAKEKSKTGSGGPVVRSFDIDEADNSDDGDHQKRKKRKKRKRGLGFGGGENMIDPDEDTKKDEMGSLSTNAYGKEALEQLKSEQKRQAVPREPLQSTTSPNAESPQVIQNLGESHDTPEESFISFNDSGEENDRSSENYDRKKGQDSEIFVVDDPPPNESHGWERQIEQRAGIKASSISSHQLSNSKLLSLDELSQKLKSTVETIDGQREELQNSTNRLRADREHAMVNSKEHQESLRKTGLACEFYQSTRRDLTLWVGALRDLQEKVRPIDAAFREMLQVQSKEFGHEFRAWQDDCVATLYQNRRLDRVLGRQPESTLLTRASNEIVIDEFGRDVRSQYLRDRDLRFKERTEYIDHNKSNNSDSTISNRIVKSEDHDEEERSKILQEALSAALDDLDQEYTSAIGLKIIFDDWFEAYFDDYQQCFATLSFGDLYAVLVRVELLKSNFFSDVLSSRATGKSTSKASQRSILKIESCFLDPAKTQDDQGKNSDRNQGGKVVIENEGRLARAVEKGVLPLLVKILNDDEGKGDENSLYVFYSSEISSLISRLINDVAIHPLKERQNSSLDHSRSSSNSKSSRNDLRQQLQTLVSAAIQNALDGISIPLLSKEGQSEHDNDDGNNNGSSLLSPSNVLDCSIKFASVYMIQILQQTLCNIITHWFPLIDIDTHSDSLGDGQAETGIHYVLNFINEKYLVLLSSIDNVGESSSEPLSSAKDFFKPIWEALNAEARSIIESPSMMLSTMPLRAAARAYQLN